MQSTTSSKMLCLCLLFIAFYSQCLLAFRIGHFSRPLPVSQTDAFLPFSDFIKLITNPSLLFLLFSPHLFLSSQLNNVNVNGPTNYNKVVLMVNPKPSGFPNTKEGRTVIYDRTKKLIEKSSMILVVPISGVKKTDIDLLRNALPSGIKASVVKNGIFRRALDGTQFQPLQTHLKQENMYFFIPEGLYKESLNAYKKWLVEIERKDEEYNAKVACLEGTIFEKLQIEEACKTPTRKEVMGRFVRVLRSIPTNIHSSINSVPRELVLTLDRIKDKKEAAEKVEASSSA